MLKQFLSNDYVGLAGSTFAALCCLGTPILLLFLTAIGLGFLINDLVLFPMLAIFLAISIYSRYKCKRYHENKYPFYITLFSGILLFPALFLSRTVAFVLIISLIGSSIWDRILKIRCKNSKNNNDG